MQYRIRLFPEITIKSTPVRKRMIKRLQQNLQAIFKGQSVIVKKGWDKLEVFTEQHSQSSPDIEQQLCRIPGIANFSRVREFPFIDFDDTFEKAKTLWGEQLSGKTFVVRVKRTGKHDFKSIDLEQYVGGYLLHNTDASGVKMKGADLTLHIEVNNNQLYLLEQTFQGLGGFPLGTQEAVLSLMSGGFDSTVASYLTIKRGLKTHFLFFNLGGRAHELGVKEVAHYIWQRYGQSHKVRFITVPFENVVAEILTQVDSAFMGVILKRMMLRVAEQVAEQMNVYALVTGESVAQVSSQTLPNLAVIDQVTNSLVLRPLVTMDKSNIIEISRHIGTEDFAANMPEYCGVISVKPTTHATLEKVLAQEQKFCFDVLDQAFSERKEEWISTVLDDLAQRVDVESFSIPQPNSVLLDIRHPDEIERNPLQITGAEIKELPFFRLQSGFRKLSPDSKYLLYCDKGVMSRLHAELLLEEGFENVAVYRPQRTANSLTEKVSLA